MSEVTVSKLPAAIEGKFNLALTQSNFQKLADKEGKLVYNEDNIEEIKNFLIDLRAVEKQIETTHEQGKAPAWKECKDWDLGKNTFLSTVAPIKARAHGNYTKLCKDIEDRNRKQEEEKRRVEGIKQTIETTAVQFAKEISECTTTPGLTAIESRINLEKTRTTKYAEFLQLAITRFSELNGILKTQKESVKELERLELERKEAEESGDDNKLIETMEKQESISNKILENQTVVQETAINQSLQSETISVAQEVIPTVKARRTTWKYEMVNKDLMMKKSPELLVVSLDKEKVDGVLKTLKDTKQLEGKTEFVMNGLRFYEEKTF